MKLLSTVIFAVAMGALAEDVKTWTDPNHVTWRFDCAMSNGTAVITGGKGYGAALKIPARVNDGTNSLIVTGIGNEAFCRTDDPGASKIRSVVIPGCVTNIGDGAFFGCSGLKSVAMHRGVVSIGSRTFHACDGLSDVMIPDGVTDIGEGAFSFCKGLVNITIPGSVTNIGDYAFIYDDSLRSVVFTGNAPIFGVDVFRYLNEECVIYVPDASTGWDVQIPGKWQGLKINHQNADVKVSKPRK